MRGLLLFILSFTACLTPLVSAASVPDSVYLFAYANPERAGQNGLEFAWSADKEQWNAIGHNYSELNSDYGPWGSQKRMTNPSLFRDASNRWHCVFSLNDRENVFAYASSPDLLNWTTQRYPELEKGRSFIHSSIGYDRSAGRYLINYSDKHARLYQISTSDFNSYSPSKELQGELKQSSVLIRGQKRGGQILRVEYSLLQRLLEAYQARQFRNLQNAETTSQDPQRFAGLKPVRCKISLKNEKSLPISDMLIGAFFEDISYAADGGLYAELIQNRDFEYNIADKKGRDASWNALYAWTADKEGIEIRTDSLQPVHVNNRHYLRVKAERAGASVFNAGYDGISLGKSEKYRLSLFVRNEGKAPLTLNIRLVDGKGKVIAGAALKTGAAGWQKKEVQLVASQTITDARLQISAAGPSAYCLDMVSLFPHKTFRNRQNGLRADLAEAVAGMKPRFVRFPGGCVAHGDGLANIYDWKGSIGPLEERVPMRNIWNYHQTRGLGYFEYFQFCEDLGAEPVPVLAAGVPCQNSGTGGNGQQGGIPMEEMKDYIQDVIDLVEYANGPVSSYWGRKRAQAGHPEPFNLKYIGIGNEDLISDIFEERFTMIYQALRKAHPEITIIGTAGPFCEGTDYREGWRIADELQVPVMDEHYYQTPGWFINNQNFYDSYRRNGAHVYLGEYAAHLPGRPNNLETALAEALYLTAVERNGDIVKMTSYAPLLAKEKHTSWNPNLIYFNNTEVKTTVGYEVQKLFGNNAGKEYLPADKWLSVDRDDVRARIGCSVVKDGQDIIIKLVNLLPVSVDQSFDLNGLDLQGRKARLSTLSGDPGDRMIAPRVSDLILGKDLRIDMEPYSFNLIRISK